MATGSKAVIKNADMSEEMQSDAIDCATQVRARRREAGACVSKGGLKSRLGCPMRHCQTAGEVHVRLQLCMAS